MMASFLEGFGRWFTSSSTLTRLTMVDFGVQWVLWGAACLLKTEKFYDLAGSGTFVLLAYLNYRWNYSQHPRQTIQTGCVMVWALRLGLYLFVRIVKAGKDRRFDKIRDNPVHFFSAWTIQGMWVIVTLLPTLLAVLSPRQGPVSKRDYIGWAIWTVGFITEVVADFQKTAFRNDPANEGKFISTGLWSLSRHPNYFGEIILWFGLYISASSTFTGYEYLTVLCPLLDYLLITKISGIPMLETYALKKWGTSPQYQQYLKKTPILVPFFGRTN